MKRISPRRGSKIVKHLQRQKHGPVIIRSIIGLVLGPSTALCISFLEHCSMTNKAVWDYMTHLSKPPQRRQGPDRRPSTCTLGRELAYSLGES